MPIIELAYGRSHIRCEIPEKNIWGIIDVPPAGNGTDARQMIEEALLNPIGTPRLGEIVKAKKAKTALVVVNDVTRPTPYQYILPPLIAELEASRIEPTNITLLVATGIHRRQTPEENRRLYGAEICQKCKVVNHDCDHGLVEIGRLADGTPVVVNELVREHDLIITTGLIGLHYFAGYSGGRKSILPGIASRSLITANHAMMIDPRCRIDNIEDNPVHKIMMEAARLVGVDFILNVVTDAHGELVTAVAGDLEKAWLEGVAVSRKLSTVLIEEPADVVIASCGGFPKDINLYQAQKALDGAAMAVKKGGTIILTAECGEGLGEDTFERWINEASSPEEIETRVKTAFELGGHKAYAISRLTQQADVYLVSSLPESTVLKCFLKPAARVEQALSRVLAEKEEAKVLIMPHAANVAVRVKGV